MALVDNRTQLCDSEAATQVSGDTDAAPAALSGVAGTIIEGSDSIEFQVDDAQEALWFDQDTGASTFSVNMSDMTLYMMVKFGNAESFANLGGLFCFKDAADGAGGDGIGYTCVGSDVAGLPYEFGFFGMKLDVSVVVAAPGTNNVDYFQYFGTEAGLDHTAVVQVGYGSFSLVKAVSSTPNAWCDGIYYIANDSYALTIQGGTSGTPETMVDAAGDDVTSGIGMINNPKGAEYGFFAPTEWGTPSGAADSYFTGSDEQWYLIGDNAGGHAVGTGHFPFRVIGNSTGTNSMVLDRIVIVGIGTRADWDLTNADFDILNYTGVTWADIGTIDFPTANDVDKNIIDNIFNNCDQVTFGATTADGCVFNGTTDALGAVLWSTTPADVAFQDNFTFNSDATGHAIHINLNTASLTTYNIDGYTVTGYETTSDGSTGNTVFLVDNALDGDVTINVSNGTGTFSYERAAGYTGTVTVNSTFTVTATVLDEDGNAVSGAAVRFEEPGGTLITQGNTNGSGVYTDNVSVSPPQATTIKVRLKGFKFFRTTGTIESTGLAVGVRLTTDKVVDLP